MLFLQFLCVNLVTGTQLENTKIHNHLKIDECSVPFTYIHGSCQFAPIRSRKIKIVQDIETCIFKLLSASST